MTLKQAIDLIIEILKTMNHGEIRIIVRGGEIKHVNCLQEYKAEKNAKP